VLVLVRHAVPHLPRAGGPDGLHRGPTAEGHAQAAALVDPLARLVRVVSSPYLRAVQTVGPLAAALGPAGLGAGGVTVG
jgi:2,3-bisphosphoglycerate-dependent phosphoglycerate mutase